MNTQTTDPTASSVPDRGYRFECNSVKTGFEDRCPRTYFWSKRQL